MMPCPHYGCNFRNENGFCKVTTCANPDYNGMMIRVANTIKVAPKTNADRIRNMTDEELAEFIGRCVDHEFHIECVCFLNQFGYCQYPTRGCDENALEWLKQEVDT